MFIYENMPIDSTTLLLKGEGIAIPIIATPWEEADNNDITISMRSNNGEITAVLLENVSKKTITLLGKNKKGAFIPVDNFHKIVLTQLVRYYKDNSRWIFIWTPHSEEYFQCLHGLAQYLWEISFMHEQKWWEDPQNWKKYRKEMARICISINLVQ